MFGERNSQKAMTDLRWSYDQWYGLFLSLNRVYSIISVLNIDRVGEADYITLAGSGEPTLHSRFGEVIEFIREASGIPVALLTNGALLGNADVRATADPLLFQIEVIILKHLNPILSMDWSFPIQYLDFIEGVRIPAEK